MTRKPNPWGLFDMNGNAYEYCSDWWSTTFSPDPVSDPHGPTAPDEHGSIVVLSGSWGANPMHCRSAFRGSAAKDHCNRRDGFRIVRELDGN
jgi:formylglycine-generating enzyme required for sulfatase activity